jgi:hypothetical protein
VSLGTRTGVKGCLKRIVLWISVVVLLLLLAPANAAIKRYQLNHADHSRILAACREAIAKRGSYRNDSDKWRILEKDEVLLLHPIPTDFPEAIRELHPRYILIREDSVLIDFNVPFARVALLGFRSGSKQYGTSRYIDGLWFWDGHDASKSPTGD